MPMLEAQIKPFILFIIIICLINLTIIYSKINESIGNRKEIIAFKGMLISFMAYALVDLRLLNDHFYTSLPKIFILLIMGVGFSSMSFSCYFWFLYVSTSINSKIMKTMLWRVGIHIPLLFDLVLLFTPLHVLVYEVTDTVVFNPMLFWVMVMDYVYLIAATIISLYKRNHSRNKLEKNKYSSQILFILFFTFCGFIIAFFLNLPAIELCTMPVVLKIFLDLQESRIYTDALTGLNNRRRINEYIDAEIATCSEDNPLTIIMIDLDYFKSINDVLGHDEGDKALITLSKALLRTVRYKNAAAGRWGGDEFIIAGKEKDLSENFREKLSAELEQENDLAFVPPFSVGTYICTSPSMSGTDAISEADSLLYIDKKKQHSQIDSFNNILRSLKQNNKI